MEPKLVPPVMPTADSTDSTAVRRPRSCIISWVMTETLAGKSRTARPRREPVAGAASRGREKFLALSAMTSMRSSTTRSSLAAGLVVCAERAETRRREQRERRRERETERGRDMVIGCALDCVTPACARTRRHGSRGGELGGGDRAKNRRGSGGTVGRARRAGAGAAGRRARRRSGEGRSRTTRTPRKDRRGKTPRTRA